MSQFYSIDIFLNLSGREALHNLIIQCIFFLLKMCLGFYKPLKISLKVPKKFISELAAQTSFCGLFSY